MTDNVSNSNGGECYQQEEGGPIGVRVTGSASEIVMLDWAIQYLEILESSGLWVPLLAGYLDDGRQESSSFPEGVGYNKETRLFEHSEAALKEDLARKKEGESLNQRMARVCSAAMNAINPDLVFTVEVQEDFQNERLPTLDFQAWLSNGVISHSFYQKPMKTPYVLMARSAMAQQQKYQILSNDLTRRLSNILVSAVSFQEILDIINQFTKEIKSSGYSVRQAREIIMSGIRGWQARARKRKRENQEFYRLASTTLKDRTRKKLIEREMWYKDQNKETEEESPRKFMKIDSNTRKPSGRGRLGKKTQERAPGNPVKAVMFIPHTIDSGLAKALRKNEEFLQEITGERVKIVEKAGTKLEDILTKTDPWKGLDCGRENCFLCATKALTGKGLSQDCSKRNIVYEIKCLTCEEQEMSKIKEIANGDQKKLKELREGIKIHKYLGETGRSAFERGFEHLNQLTTLSDNSHMLKHVVAKHEGQDLGEIKFGMSILHHNRSAFERQIREAVKIQQERKDHVLLNSRSEYNQCSLPRLTTRMGDNQLWEWEQEMKQEKEEEDIILGKIRQLRKSRNKARLTTGKSEPGAKRRKTAEDNYISIREVWGPPTISAPQKTSPLEETQPAPQKKRLKVDNEPRYLEIITPEETPILWGEELDMEKYEVWDWEEAMKNHRRKLEEERAKREERLEEHEKKRKHWELAKVCKSYLEENNKNWATRRRDRELERQKIERLEVTKRRKTDIKEKMLERKVTEEKEMLPRREKEMIEIEERKVRRLEIQEVKDTLWKLKGREKKYEKKSEYVQQLENIQNLEEKLEKIQEVLERVKEEEKLEKERKLENEKRLKAQAEGRKKVRIQKEIENKEKLEQEKMLGDRWALVRWLNNFMLENNENWEKEKLENLKLEKEKLENWEKMKRLEKIKFLKNS